MPIISFIERRARQRVPANGLLVTVRRSGRISRLEGAAVDFSRFGVGIILDQSLPKDSLVYLKIVGAAHYLDGVIGIVHNCIALDAGYRCGIQFRTSSELQDNQQQIKTSLTRLENQFKNIGATTALVGD